MYMRAQMNGERTDSPGKEEERTIVVALRFGVHGNELQAEECINRVQRMLQVEMHRPIEIVASAYTTNGGTVSHRGTNSVAELLRR